uniref:Uncharacterized protein n=1 Tax=Arion vulgaris TaxID=1028688 RepID=A0A0B6ZZA1_9EUPU
MTHSSQRLTSKCNKVRNQTVQCLEVQPLQTSPNYNSVIRADCSEDHDRSRLRNLNLRENPECNVWTTLNSQRLRLN